NIVQYLGMLDADVLVRRNDKITCAEARTLPLTGIVLSPGPGTPADAGCTLEFISEFSGVVPILGICLGHQAIGTAFGARLIRAPRPVHGKTSLIHHAGDGLFSGLPQPLQVGRYHSLILETETIK